MTSKLSKQSSDSIQTIDAREIFTRPKNPRIRIPKPRWYGVETYEDLNPEITNVETYVEDGKLKVYRVTLRIGKIHIAVDGREVRRSVEKPLNSIYQKIYMRDADKLKTEYEKRFLERVERRERELACENDDLFESVDLNKLSNEEILDCLSELNLDEDEIAEAEMYMDRIKAVSSLPKLSKNEVFKIHKEVEEEILYEMLMNAFFKARQHKRNTFDERKFENNLFGNILSLTRSIIDRTYTPSNSVAFVVFNPVTREIFAAPFRDRVVHHFLFDWCYPWWSKRFIQDSYSCQEEKGTLYGIKRCYKKMRQVSENYKYEAYVAKFDVKSFFMSLPRVSLFDRISWGLERQFPERGWIFYVLKFLWYQIIMDDPALRAVRRGDPTNWGTKGGPKVNRHGKKNLPPEKSLFYQTPGVGIVIGNLTSQLLSNIYLDLLDRFVRYALKFKYYGRYVDDFYIYVRKEELPKLKDSIPLIEAMLELIGLKLHPNKRYLQPIEHGVEFIGARIYPYRLLPSYRLVRNFKRACDEVSWGVRTPDAVPSYLGFLIHYKTKKLVKHVFDNHGWRANPGPAEKK